MRNLLKRLPKSFGSAFFQVALIFLGVTLAIGFGNWNTGRAERREELAILEELHSDLEFNIETLNQMLERNTLLVAKLDSIIQHLELKMPPTDEFRAALKGVQGWTSPYLSRGTYETLKSKGVDVVTDRAIRGAVIRLYENVYGDLVNDRDRSEWVNYEVSSIPQLLKYIEELPDGSMRVTDYQAMMNDRGFLTAMYRSRRVRVGTNIATTNAMKATEAVLEQVAGYLAAANGSDQ